MKKNAISTVIIMCFATTLPSFAVCSIPEQSLTLSHEVTDEALLAGQYWMSEKLDGIKAIWTGKALITRKGKRINAPKWFTENLPEENLEGELWAGRGEFNLVQKTVLDSEPNEDEWRKIRYMVFDMPKHGISFSRRYAQLKESMQVLSNRYVQLIEQVTIASYDALVGRLQEIESAGGEGIILRAVALPDKVVKVKRFVDSEGIVIGYTQGRGKYSNMVGSILVKLEGGKILAIGSGLTDKLRQTPPKVGETVTFRYNGVTKSGLPRFARFIRTREPE